MPMPFQGRILSFVVSDAWLPDPMLVPMMSQQFLTYRFIPQIAMRDQILYGTLQIREVINPMEKSTLLTQLQLLNNPMMAAAILTNLGVQPMAIAAQLQQIDVKGFPCSYRIIEAMALITGQPVRCYLGLIDFGMYAAEVIAITVLSQWPALLPQLLEMFTSVTPNIPDTTLQPAQRAPIYINQDASGKIAFKVEGPRGQRQVFDELQIPEFATVNINIDKRTVNIGKDTAIKGHINFGDNNKLEGFTMEDTRNINIGGSATVGDIFQGDHVQVDKSVQSGLDPKAFAQVIDELLAAIKKSGATDANAKLATMELEKAKVQSDVGEEESAVARTLDSAVNYLKKSEDIVKSGVSIGKILLKIGKVLGVAIGWL